MPVRQTSGEAVTTEMECVQRFLLANDLYILSEAERGKGRLLFHIYERRTHRLFLDDGPYTIAELIDALDITIIWSGQVPA